MEWKENVKLAMLLIIFTKTKPPTMLLPIMLRMEVWSQLDKKITLTNVSLLLCFHVFYYKIQKVTSILSSLFLLLIMSLSSNQRELNIHV